MMSRLLLKTHESLNEEHTLPSANHFAEIVVVGSDEVVRRDEALDGSGLKPASSWFIPAYLEANVTHVLASVRPFDFSIFWDGVERNSAYQISVTITCLFWLERVELHLVDIWSTASS